MAIQNVLVSVFKKQGIAEFVSTLVKEFNVHVLSTGGTARLLKSSGIDVQDVSDFTGAPELFDGRVKTLHPKVEGGILFRRDNPKDVAEARANDIIGIDMVVCNLYPFQDTIQDPNVPLDDAIEMIDVGGPTMIRAAAKNFKHVTIVSSEAHIPVVLKEMRENHGSTTIETRMKLAVDVFKQTSTYDAAIFKFLERRTGQQSKFPDVLVKIYEKVHPCRYGENWDQEAAFYADKEAPLGIHSLKKLWGKEISYNNYLDIDACFQILSDFNQHEHACAIFKHMNPNGVAVDAKTQMNACINAFNCDPLSAFGGIWGFNKPLEPAVAEYLIHDKKVFIEVLLAPSIPPDSKAILETKENMRVLEFGDMLSKRDVLYRNMEVHGLLGGILLEDYDSKPVVKEWKLMSNREVTEQEKQALEFSMVVCKWAKSNSAVFSRTHGSGICTLGIGTGQQSRVHVVKLAHSKALEFGHDTKNSVMATDSFFPFPDGLEAAAEAGAVAIICPGGSIRDDVVIQRAKELGVSLVFNGKRVFKH